MLIEETQPFKAIKDDPARAATAIHTACRLLWGLSILLRPFVPVAFAPVVPGAPVAHWLRNHALQASSACFQPMPTLAPKASS